MRVAILGAGYAGLVLARALDGTLPDDTDLVVVDESSDHLLQHELHRVVRRPAAADHVRVPLDDLLGDARRVEARVTDVDTDGRRVSFADREPMAYDVAAVCLGAETDTFDLPGVAEYGLPLKRVAHAETIRERALAAPDGGRLVVAGAGLSGVQVAGELAALADEVAGGFEVRLLEQAETVAPGFGDRFGAALREELEARGVAVHTDCEVTRAAADAVHVAAGEVVSHDGLVWTAGIRGSDALGGERVPVRANLALDGRTFAVGDAARVVDAEGRAVPASAQAAVREARTAAANVRAVCGGERPREQFRFDSRGWLVSVGDGAVAKVGPTVVTGRAARVLERSVGAGYLASAGALGEAAERIRAL